MGSKAEKYASNVAAIRTLQAVESENRLATPEEQETLSCYVGWGGLADCFDESTAGTPSPKALLTEEEYAAARASSLTAFYTPPVLIDAIYQALAQMGLESGNLLEPACGIGNFMGMLPDSMRNCKVYGVELDSISGRIARQLYQNSRIAVTGYEKAEIPDSFLTQQWAMCRLEISRSLTGATTSITGSFTTIFSERRWTRYVRAA